LFLRSLRDHLLAKFGGAASPAFQRAQRCFVESLAAYSLVCYLLQIKDR
jgi:phosphatidylinositol 4-kinase